MRRYETLSGSREDDRAVFAEKFGFLASQLSPEVNESSFTRVLTISGLPDFQTGQPEQYVDAHRLGEITQSSEWQAFRQWLRNVGDVTDEEIRDQLHPLRDRLVGAFQSPSMKAVRFLVTTGVGYLPRIGPQAAVALSALDSFVLHKVISRPGPISFLSRLYRSIFE